MKLRMLGAIAGLLFAAAPAHAAGCPGASICAADPATVVAALQAGGFKAQLGKSEQTGNPLIDSAANGYNFKVYFYGCEAAAGCSSLGFAVNFAKDSTNTPALANLWNKTHRFSQMAINDDGTLAFTYDVTTVGGLNRANFADVVDWWQTMLGEVGKFFKEHPPK